ncbi:Vacuolar protein sorting-associated protein 41 [Blastocladiella emersonii ATCC 22665]|nr:Vacuolar protein sorting-associated protein 41 [Blastocladiella emersonii ATCC 22665]
MSNPESGANGAAHHASLPGSPDPLEGMTHDHEVSASAADESDQHDASDEDEDGLDAGFSTDDDEVEPEPTLKYSRLGGELPSILATDAISTATCNEKFLVFGTHSGFVYVFDFSGTFLKKFTPHRSSVTDVCIDSKEEYIASSGDDGMVVVCNLFTDEVQVYEFRRPIKCLSLDPEYSKSRRFAAGGHAGEVVLFEKTWRGPKKVVIDQPQSRVLAVEWRGQLIAYVSEAGLGIYDVKSSRVVCMTHVPFESTRPELYRPHLVWKNDETLVFGWQKMIQIIEVKIPSMFELGYQARILVQASTDVIIGGLQPYDSSLLLIGVSDQLYEDDADEAVERHPPETIVFDPEALEPVVSRDVLSVHGYEHIQSTEYRLVSISAERTFFLVSPKDVITVRGRDINDQIEWRLEHRMFEEALQLSIRAGQQNAPLRPEYRAAQIGQSLLGSLLEGGEAEHAASLCPLVLAKSAELWERWTFVFAEQDELDALLPYVPLANPVLDHTVYEVILAHYLSSDFAVFSDLISRWPRHLYNTPNVISALEDTLMDHPDDKDLLGAAIVLYRSEKQVYKELVCHIELHQFAPALALLEENPQMTIPLLRHRAVVWFDFCLEQCGGDVDKLLESGALKQIAGRTHLISTAEVVQLLASRRLYQFVYLQAVFERDTHEAPELHGLLLELLVEFRPAALMDFLQRSIYYPLDRALQLSQDRDLLPEQVFVLGRIGNHKRAMEIMMDRMDDIEMAIEYAKRQQDEDLWHDLVDFAVEKPKYWGPLFRTTGMYLDPIQLIKRVPRNASIDGLKGLLTSIVHDFATQIEVRSQAQHVLRNDVLQHLTTSMRRARGGVPIDPAAPCSSCGVPIGAADVVPDAHGGGGAARTKWRPIALDGFGVRHKGKCPPPQIGAGAPAATRQGAS